MVEEILKIQNLRVYFPTMNGIVKAVDDVSLDIKREEIVGLVGESGSGKTTTGLSVMRLVPFAGEIVSGEILIDGQNIVSLSDSALQEMRGKEVSMIFQDPMTFLNPVMKVGNQVVEVLQRHRGLTKREAEREVVNLFREVRLPDPEKMTKRYPHELSGGMKQRILISMAISCDPKLVIADEPTTALDATVQRSILNLLKDLKEKRKMSCLLITHDLGIVAELCDRVYIMYAGKIAEYGSLCEVFESPKHPYTDALLASVLSIDEMKQELVSIEGSVPSLLNPPSGCRFHPRCPKAMGICSEKEPLPFTVEEGMVFCWRKDSKGKTG